jgi:hypothetical protein
MDQGLLMAELVGELEGLDGRVVDDAGFVGRWDGWGS